MLHLNVLNSYAGNFFSQNSLVTFITNWFAPRNDREVGRVLKQKYKILLATVEYSAEFNNSLKRFS